MYFASAPDAGVAENLLKFGPFAAIALFIYVIEGKVRSMYKEADPATRNPFLALYIFTWIMTFGLIGYCSWFWVHEYRQNVIAGTIVGLQGNETIHNDTPDVELFLAQHSENLPSIPVSYNWRIVDRRLDDGTPITFRLSRGSNKPESQYELKIQSSFYDSPVRLVYLRDKNTFRQDHNGKQALMTEQPLTARSTEIHPGSWLPVVYAEEKVSPKQLVEYLDSSDVGVRKNVQVQLARQGPTALPEMEAVAADPKKRYSVWLGVLSALNQMKGIGGGNVSPVMVRAMIAEMDNVKLPTHDQAKAFLVAHPTWDIESELSKEIDARKKASRPAAELYELAHASYQVLYLLGLQEKDKLGAAAAENREHFEKAVGAFKKSWDRRTLAADYHLNEFPKALFGWGLALHDRSVVEHAKGQPRNPAFVKAAQDKFAEFLREETATQEYLKKRLPAGQVKRYPYPDHLAKASAYLKDPSEKKLQ